MAIKNINLTIIVSFLLMNCTNYKNMEELEVIDLLYDRYGNSVYYEMDDKEEYVTKVQISNSEKLTEFPEELKAFKRIKSILLEGGEIKTIPEFITNFESLELLSVGGNPIERLPDYLANCKKLKVLGITGTYISTFPQNFGKLPLQKLYFTNTEVEGFPEVLYEFDSLKGLGLNRLDELPSDIENFKYLLTLRAYLKSFKHIEKITSLKILNLGGSTATHLPKDFGNLQDLQSLKLADCKNLIRLPESIGEIIGFYGITLNGCTKLTALPKGLTKSSIGILELDRCYNLRTVAKGLQVGSIWAVDTKWKTIPSGIFYSEAHSLNIINHEVTNIIGIGNMYNLTHCNLSNGKIKYIPDDIGKLKELVHLNLENNDIKHYNSALNNCPKLNTVGLFGNPVFDVEAIED